MKTVAIIIARMSRRPAPGRTAARDPDPSHDEAGRPSKTQRKKDSADLQDLGLELTRLSAGVVATLELPDALRDALAEYARTRRSKGEDEADARFFPQKASTEQFAQWTRDNAKLEQEMIELKQRIEALEKKN